MSEQKPTLSTGFQVTGTNFGNLNIEDRNITLVRGNEHNARAGGNVQGDQRGTVNSREQNLATNAVGAELTELIMNLQPGQKQRSDTDFKINARVVIFNQGFDRPGSELDVENLKNTFRKRGVEPTVQINSKYFEILSTIDQLSTTDLSCFKLFVCIVMSHGNTNGRIHAVDREFEVKREIIDPIGKNESLRKVPKVFIIVACRGSNEYVKCDSKDLSIREKDQEIDGFGRGFKGVAGAAPYLISYSTLEDHVSYRSVEQGTFFIDSFCKRVNEATGETDIHSIFTAVNDDLSNKYQVQVPVFQSAMGSVRFKDLA